MYLTGILHPAEPLASRIRQFASARKNPEVQEAGNIFDHVIMGQDLIPVILKSISIIALC